MLIIWMPTVFPTNVSMKQIQALLDSGGRVFSVCENARYFVTVNKVVTQLATSLGCSFAVSNSSIGELHITTDINSDSELTEGLTGFPSFFVAPITYTGSAVPVATTAAGQGQAVFLVDQAAGNGLMTVISDIDGMAYSTDSNIVRFYRNLLSTAVAAQNKAMDGDNPNAGFGGSPTYVINALMVSQDDLGKTAYSFTVTYASQNSSLFDDTTVGTDDVSVKNASGTALTVTGASVTGGTGTTGIIVTYTVTPPGGSWDTADNGGYTIALTNAAVSTVDGKQTGGNNSAATFTVDLTEPPLATATPGHTVILTTSTGISGFQYRTDSTNGTDGTWQTYSAPLSVNDGGSLYIRALIADGCVFTNWADGIPYNPCKLEDITADLSFTPTATLLTRETEPAADFTVTANQSHGSGDRHSHSTIISCTLTFDTNGGSTIPPVTETSGTVVNLSGYTPMKDGYTFDGWYADQALTEKITTVTLNRNETVFARWTKDEVNPNTGLISRSLMSLPGLVL